MKITNKIKLLANVFAGALNAHSNKQYRPVITYYLPTYKCPWSCEYCHIQSTNGKELSPSQSLDLISQMADSGVVRLHFSGGEPMLRDDIAEMIGCAKKRGLYVGISSSGYLIPEKINELRDVDIVFLSLEGEEDIHDHARGKGSYRVCMDAMDSLKGKGIKCWTTTVINKNSYKSIDYILDLAKEKGFMANFVMIHSLDAQHDSYFNSREDAEKYLMSPQEIKKTINKLIKFKKMGLSIGTSEEYLKYILRWGDYSKMYKKENSEFKCWAGKLYCWIDPEGNIYPCGNVSGRILGQNGIELGFKNAFNRLVHQSCQGCLSGCQTEQNFIFSFNFRSILNWLKKF